MTSPSTSQNARQTEEPSHNVVRASMPHARIKKHSPEHNNSAKKRRSSAKLIDPVEVVTLVVAGPRGNGKFVCPLCASDFGRRCELKRHVAEVHTINGARRFSCKHPSCGKSFTRKDALAKHEVVKHQGKKRFICPTCSEKFTSRYDLSRHNIRVHSNVKKRFTCEFCLAGFSQKSQLTMHKGRVHSSSSGAISTSPSRTSMDSLAAAAVAIAEEEERAEKRNRRVESNQNCTKSTIKLKNVNSRSNSCFDDKTQSEREKEDSTLAADALLEAAAVLSPMDNLSSAPTMVTDMSDQVHHSPETHIYGEAERFGHNSRNGAYCRDNSDVSNKISDTSA